MIALNDFVFQVKDLRYRLFAKVHISRLVLYFCEELEKEVILPHIRSSKAGMTVQRLMGHVDTKEAVMVKIHWRGLPQIEDTLEPLLQAFRNVPDLVRRLLF